MNSSPEVINMAKTVTTLDQLTDLSGFSSTEVKLVYDYFKLGVMEESIALEKLNDVFLKSKELNLPIREYLSFLIKNERSEDPNNENKSSSTSARVSGNVDFNMGFNPSTNAEQCSKDFDFAYRSQEGQSFSQANTANTFQLEAQIAAANQLATRSMLTAYYLANPNKITDPSAKEILEQAQALEEYALGESNRQYNPALVLAIAEPSLVHNPYIQQGLTPVANILESLDIFRDNPEITAYLKEAKKQLNGS
jgi:hypothetical protein